MARSSKKRRSRAKPLRTDLLRSPLTKRKASAIAAVVEAYRKGAVLLAEEQWRLFETTGRFNKRYDVDKKTYAVVIGSPARVQMCRWQVVGQLRSWVSNRANEYREVVVASSLPEAVKHMLHVINVFEAWFVPEPLEMPETGQVIPDEVRALAREMMQEVMARHARPDLSHISMWVDERQARIEQPEKAKGFPLWLQLPTLRKRERIAVPLVTHPYFEERVGTRKEGVQVSLDEDGKLSFGVVTDIGAACAASRAAYAAERAADETACEHVALDFGLSVLFGTSEGDLLGRNWLVHLRRYDRRITTIARGQQRHGLKLRQSKRYREAVQDLRGVVRTEVNRVLNRLVELRKPATLVLERLDFRNPGLSAHLDRILQNCGRGVIRAKLADLRQRKGIEAVEVNAAYTSQTCSACGYVDKRNRRALGTFLCLHCGHEKHADLNAARNVKSRRATISVFLSRDGVLAEVVRAFGERRVRATRSGRLNGQWGLPADPRSSNPYFRGETASRGEVKESFSRRLSRLHETTR